MLPMTRTATMPSLGFHDSSDPEDRFVEALGIVVDTVPYADVVAVIRGHIGPVAIRVVASNGEILEHADGYVEWVDGLGFHADDDTPGRFVFSNSSERAPHPTRGYEFRPIPIGELHIPESEHDRYLGGFAHREEEDGRTSYVVLWHDVLHVTESGDVAPGFAPGFGAVDVVVTDEDDDDE
jgi:hypothetical protein